MKKRIISAVVALILLFTVLYLNDIADIPLTNFVLAALIMTGLYEVYKPFGFIKRMPLAILGFAFGISLAFGKLSSAGFIIAVICFYMLLMFILAVCYHKTIKFSDICILLFTTIYISLGLAHVRLIKESEYGTYLLFVILIGAFLTDSGAYFTGRFLGKHKLLPDISPKKTIEGAVGGIVCALAGLGIFGLIISNGSFQPNWWRLMLVGTISSVAAQFGDLSASMIKRELNLKDYGEIMPGHGGVLDRLDSLIFVAPVVYHLNIILPLLRG